MKSMDALVLAVIWSMLAVARAEVVPFQSDGNEQTICQDIGLIKSIFLEAKSNDLNTSMTVYFGDADVNQMGFGLAYGKDKLDFSSDSASFKNQKID
ncbi:hypothetical protein [Pseudobacteriovorax antillogorgiicola]|uniref:Uncharacterized protein n=1 Tax=Pseudobacteriovorax antillogorgiicola TaxID=1513793 RepID=A0A1Y6CLR3_9BACT|nr:hypothetical protein [Pseudobacteriovorax antillogorgiicola]TCS48001.1 hypothetical protein EDD56_119112 [Pseudobacteriovorax antillogorgiicola]SMF58515.1 hypothetical protein SAMN06296036_119113 [Pseudobacteriovorax antillogorgiicola]